MTERMHKGKGENMVKLRKIAEYRDNSVFSGLKGSNEDYYILGNNKSIKIVDLKDMSISEIPFNGIFYGYYEGKYAYICNWNNIVYKIDMENKKKERFNKWFTDDGCGTFNVLLSTSKYLCMYERHCNEFLRYNKKTSETQIIPLIDFKITRLGEFDEEKCYIKYRTDDWNEVKAGFLNYETLEVNDIGMNPKMKEFEGDIHMHYIKEYNIYFEIGLASTRYISIYDEEFNLLKKIKKEDYTDSKKEIIYTYNKEEGKFFLVIGEELYCYEIRSNEIIHLCNVGRCENINYSSKHQMLMLCKMTSGGYHSKTIFYKMEYEE